ncbi:MAG: hypothetical protein U9Q77_06665 [Candidatus Marinimicrobia bacterium]|nr:hypothetical protein [Candidatus Neomarinimicrobiota bacterium]
MLGTKFSKLITRAGLLILIIGLMWSCSFFGDRKKKQYRPIDFDLSQDVGPFNGMGANVPISFYSRRMKPLQTLNDLGIKVIRVKREADNWDDILALRTATQRLGIKWVYSVDAIPANFVDRHGQLADIKGFAGWWAEEVDELFYQEVPADYIELLSRPDSSPNDSLPLTPDSYNALIHAVRKELDLRDFQQVGIVGPSLSTPELSGDLESWYMNLDQEAFDILDHWTVHAWADSTAAENIGSAVADLKKYLSNIESLKPIWVSSYATAETNFNHEKYPDPDRYDQIGNLPGFETYYYSASFSMPYALRVYSNTLRLLEHGGVMPLIYQLYDAPTDVKHKKQSRGLLDLNGVAKPAFTTLINLIKRIPANAVIVPASENLQPNLMSLCFRSQEQVVVTICNENTSPQTIQVRMHGSGHSMEFTRAVGLHAPEIFPGVLGKRDGVKLSNTQFKLRWDGENNSYFFVVTIAPQSIIVAEFLLN